MVDDDSLLSTLLDAWLTVQTEVRTLSSIDPGSEVYHYTDTLGMKGIIDSKELWLTNVRFLNDAKELEICRDIVREIQPVVANSIETKFGGGAAAPIIFSAVEGFLDEIQRRSIAEHAQRIYVCCFSSLGDSLSQWRSYGNGGEGYSIGFRASNLCSMEGVQIFNIIYDREVFANLFKDLVERSCQAILMHYSPGYEELLANRLAAALHDGFLELSTYFKSHHFSDEREVRIVKFVTGTDRSAIRFRASGSMIVPFSAINLSDLPNLGISSIAAGPRRFSAASIAGLDRYLGACDLGDVRIVSFSVPFRALK